MSHPEVNLQTQKRRHKGPLIGTAAALIFAAGLFVWWVTYEVAESDPPQGSEIQIDGRTGETGSDDTLMTPTNVAPGEAAPPTGEAVETAPVPPPAVEPAPAD